MSTETIAQYCPHFDRPAAARMCAHIIEDDINYVQTYSGVDLFYELICEECDKQGVVVAPQELCADCLLTFQEDRLWGPERMSGMPQVFERSSDLKFIHETLAIKWPTDSKIVALQPINSETSTVCLVLTAERHLLRIDVLSQEITPITTLTSEKLDFAEEITLGVSADGHWAAVANTHDQYGLVIDLATGTVTMALERDDYHIGHSPFPISFFVDDGRTLLIHATKWDRLDISDPSTGTLLTQRELLRWKDGEEAPPHYLDYFHCGLFVSPDQTWMVDNGWVWHPVGIVRSWNIKTWLQKNVWESEDGKSVRELRRIPYFWQSDVCWIDNTTVCLWGIGKDDAVMVSGVRFFDVTTGQELRSFAGPDNALEFDEYLFSHSPEQGMSVWNIVTGERLLQDKSLNPSCYHRGAQQFVTLLSDGGVRLSRLQG